MDDALLNRRLSTLGPNFPVDNGRITHQHSGPNSRATMSYIFGGDRVRTVCYPGLERRRAHGFQEPFFFPSYNPNPLLPARMGEGGILFQLDGKLENWVDDQGGRGPYHLFLHRNLENHCYFGIYNCVRIDQVSKDEWLSQSRKVRWSSVRQVR